MLPACEGRSDAHGVSSLHTMQPFPLDGACPLRRAQFEPLVIVTAHFSARPPSSTSCGLCPSAHTAMRRSPSRAETVSAGRWATQILATVAG